MAQRQWRSDDTDEWKEAFGDGSDGSTYSAPANAGCSGTSGGTSVTLDAASSFADGDLVIIHQTRGDNSNPNWELNKIASGGGTTSLTMAYDLTRTYTNSGANQAQIIEMKQYKDLDLASSTINPSDWNQSQGGLVCWFDSGTTQGTSATVNLAGSTGNTAFGTNVTSADTTGGGFYGGYGRQNGASAGRGQDGEGYPGDGAATSEAANGNGGGGGYQTGAGSCSGGGGGNGGAGTGGTSDEGSDGLGGSAVGNAGLTIFHLGGGGGGCASLDGVNQTVASGGSGGGGGFIFAKNIDLSGITLTFNGGAGGNGSRKGDGGGGAGGSCLLKCETATLGTNKITATGGSGGSTYGGNGGTGRIHIDYSDSYTGTTNPTIDARLDATIVSPTAGGAFMLNYFV